MMEPPKNLNEFHKRSAEGSKIEGYGIGSVYMTAPCPFCAAPHWMKWELLETREAMEAGAVCLECGRGAKALYTGSNGSITFEFFQTCGDDPPDWLQPKMRRIEDA